MTRAEIAAHLRISKPGLANIVARTKSWAPFPSPSGTRGRKNIEVFRWGDIDNWLDARQKPGTRLTDKQRQAIINTYIAEHSIAATVRTTGISRSSVVRVLRSNSLALPCSCEACSTRGQAFARRVHPNLFEPPHTGADSTAN